LGAEASLLSEFIAIHSDLERILALLIATWHDSFALPFLGL